jgi:uncharacterized protein YbjT (DUF2867 family)
MTRVLVTGGSGALGSLVIPTLLARDANVRVLSRKAQVTREDRQWVQADLLTGNSLKAALDGVDVVIHCASNPSNPVQDIQAAQNLIAISREQGIKHLVYISIAGIESSAWFAYYKAKLEVENMIDASEVPYSILRTTQFHSLVSNILQKLENQIFMTVPAGVSLQPIDPETVAEHLADLALNIPAGRVQDLAGPQKLEFKSLAKTWLQVLGKQKPVFSLPLPVALFRAFRDLKSENSECVGMTWETWLSRQAQENFQSSSI